MSASRLLTTNARCRATVRRRNMERPGRRANRVLADRNQGVVAVGAWVEDGEDFQQHPFVSVTGVCRPKPTVSVCRVTQWLCPTRLEEVTFNPLSIGFRLLLCRLRRSRQRGGRRTRRACNDFRVKCAIVWRSTLRSTRGDGSRW